MALLREGDIIDITEGHEVYATVPEHFLYDNLKGSFTMAHGHVVIRGELSYLAGRYVVYKTTCDGGGVDSNDGSIWPNGHHVFCERVDDMSIKVDFYQSGHFTALNPRICAVGRAVRKWVNA